MERQPVQQHPLKEHLFCLFLCRWWREEAGLKAGLQSAPSTLGVRNLCMRQEQQDGSILNAPFCSLKTFPGLLDSFSAPPWVSL